MERRSIKPAYFALSQTVAPVKGGKTFTIPAGGTAELTNANTSFHSAAGIKGPNTTLTIRKTPAPLQANRPRVLSGITI